MSFAHSKMSNSVRRIAGAAKGLLLDQNRIKGPSTIEMPQADMHEQNLQTCEVRDWRSYFAGQLAGRGLEIGPLHRPMVRHDGMQVEYIDRCTVAELREHYPELNDLPLVEPDLIGNAETMEGVPDADYDFLISAHVIEHTKNPISSLEQWCRVVRPGGLIYLIVPDKRITFDVKRVRTTLAHMVLDYVRPSAERDYEHYLDYAVHVHDKQGAAAVEEADRLRETDYSIHFHVFLPSDILQLLRWFNENIRSLVIVEGPVMSPGSDEFHFLLRVP